MPYFRLKPARSGRPAPIFWAVIAARAAIKAEGASMAKVIIRSTTPTAALSLRPMALTMAVMIRKEMVTSTFCTATGAPRETSFAQRPRWRRKEARLKSKGKSLRRSTSRERIRDSAWAEIVAMAAPAAPMPKTPTNSRSPAIFTTVAMRMKYIGRRESPSPRSMAETML